MNWNTPSRAQPYPSRKGAKLKWDELYVIHATLPTSTGAVRLFRLSAGQCDANGWSERNLEETNVTNYTVDLTHFLLFFFHPKMCFIHADTRASFFTEWEGYRKRLRTGQLPTKMDNAQDPHSPTLRTSHRG